MTQAWKQTAMRLRPAPIATLLANIVRRLHLHPRMTR